MKISGFHLQLIIAGALSAHDEEEIVNLNFNASQASEVVSLLRKLDLLNTNKVFFDDDKKEHLFTMFKD